MKKAYKKGVYCEIVTMCFGGRLSTPLDITWLSCEGSWSTISSTAVDRLFGPVTPRASSSFNAWEMDGLTRVTPNFCSSMYFPPSLAN